MDSHAADCNTGDLTAFFTHTSTGSRRPTNCWAATRLRHDHPTAANPRYAKGLLSFQNNCGIPACCREQKPFRPNKYDFCCQPSQHAIESSGNGLVSRQAGVAHGALCAGLASVERSAHP